MEGLRRGPRDAATTTVVDASVVIAVLRGEPLQPWVVERLASSTICASNYAEVVSYVTKLEAPDTELRALIDGFGLEIVALDRERAATVGELTPRTSSFGLSLGDRCCLSLARTLGLPALTTDRAWIKIAGAVGVEIMLAR